MSEIDGLDEIASIARSSNRVRILEQLYQEEHLRKHEISERINASRTTLGRNLDYLLDQGWVSNTNGEYSITPTGELVVSDFLELIDTVNSAKRIQPFLESQPLDELGLDVQALKGAQITSSTRSDPYAPVRRHVETVSSADRFRALLPTVGPNALESAKKRLQNGDAHHEVVVNSDVAELFRTQREYSELIQPLLETDHVDIHVSERRIPCYIGIVDGSVQIGANNENGIPHALLETDSQAAREWAKCLFEEFRVEARPFVMNGDEF
jgi:predicted transcriptional regulator